MKTGKTVITDPFWLRYRSVVRREMIPYQWKVLNDEIDVNIERERNDSSIPNEKSHALENFRIAAGIHEGHHYGWVFQDSDVYKWLEAVAYSLMEEPDESLKKMADSVVDLIAQAQEDDGYLGTYFTIEEPYRKFKSLMNSHELYCAGHFMEAAAAYYEAVGNQKVLDTAMKLAEHIETALGPDGEFGYDGHEEIEIGTAATGFTSLYAEREYAIRDAGGEVLARAFARWIMLDFESGHPLRMTPDITDHYVMEPSLGMEHLPRRIACREEGEPQTPFEVFRGCIDTNGHVNNSWYIRFAQNYLPEGFTVRSMRVEYRNAAVLGDMICPYVIRQDGGIIVKLCSEDKDTYAVIAFYGEKQEKA